MAINLIFSLQFTKPIFCPVHSLQVNINLYLSRLQQPRTFVPSYCWNTSPLSLIHKVCWYSDSALMEGRSIFIAVSTSALTSSSHSLTYTLSLLPVSDLAQHLLYLTIFHSIYHCHFLTTLHLHSPSWIFILFLSHFNNCTPSPSIY